MTTLNIRPFQIVKLGNVTYYATKANIEVTNVELFTKCDVRIFLKDSQNNTLYIHTLEVSPEEYQLWNEDNYLVDLICSKLGLIRDEQTEG
jgi:hypothetical protein